MVVYTKPSYANDLFFHISYQAYPFLHSHDYWEFMVVLKGTIIHKINGKVEELPQNSLCLIRPQDVHSLHHKKKQLSQHLNLGVDAKYFEEYMRLIYPTLYEDIFKGEMPMVIGLSHAKVNRLYNDANKILSADKDEYELQMKLLFMDIVREFYSETIKSAAQRNSYSAVVTQLIMLMNNPENMKRDLVELIEETNYSYSHINRLFSREVGVTPSRFFRDKKFEYAKTMIADTDMSLIDVALAIGYENYPHFSTAFKKYTGVAPMDFDRNQRNYYQSNKKEQQ
ncbi:MAG: helix-turn-helix domain-containing protein [Clostridiales bacterium]|nr:helix-turn-helix domain-containing protein [Clostridiales bacterium]